MLTMLRIKNFRGLKNTEVSFDSFTEVLGDSGCGKSTIFDVLRRLRDFILGNLTVEQAFPSSTQNKLCDNDVQEFELISGSSDKVYRYSLRISQEWNVPKIVEETLSLNWEEICDRSNLSEEQDISIKSSSSILNPGYLRVQDKNIKYFVDFISRIVVLNLDSKISGESFHEDSSLNDDGRNFANWYRFLSQENQDWIWNLILKLRKIVKNFDSFRLVQAGRSRKVLVVKFTDGLELDFDDLSEGQRALIVLYAVAFYVKNAEGFLFVDSPDRFLNRYDFLRWASFIEGFSNLQISLISGIDIDGDKFSTIFH